MRLRRTLPACLLALGLFAPSASATSIEPRDLTQLGHDASLVVEGRVSARRSYWNDAHTRILTEVTIDVQRTYKGAAPARVSVVQMGGVVDGVRMTVHGALTWNDDEDVLLFLEPSLRGHVRVSGFSQGKFGIEVDPSTGERVATRPALLGVEGGDATMRLPLGQLLERAALTAEGGR